LKGEAGVKVADWKVAGMVVSYDGAVRAGGHVKSELKGGRRKRDRGRACAV
jgi:hypothetical protein